MKSLRTWKKIGKQRTEGKILIQDDLRVSRGEGKNVKVRGRGGVGVRSRWEEGLLRKGTQ